MADNVAITAGSGTTISTEEVTTLNGGAVTAQQVQRVAAAIRTADGTAIDLPGSTADGLLVNLGANNDVTVTGTVTANAGTGPFPVSDNAGSLTIDNAALSVTGGGVEAAALRVTLASDSTGVVSVDDNGASLTVDGTVAATQSGAWNISTVTTVTTVSAVTAITNALPAGTNTIGSVGLAPQTSGGLLISRTISAATTNATSAKASAGQVFGWYLSNANASTRFFKLYNKASAPTVGTDTPVMTIPIPGGSGANVEFANGIAFATGIAYALTTGVADADTAAVAANEIVINLLYR